MARALGTVVAERILKVVGAEDSLVRIRVGKPRKDRSSGDYFCPFVIEGLQEDLVRQAWGIDSMQALHSAMQAIRLMLAPHARKLTWEGGDRGNLGLPMTIPDLFGARFSRRLEVLVERETNRHGRALERDARRRSRSRS